MTKQREKRSVVSHEDLNSSAKIHARSGKMQRGWCITQKNLQALDFGSKKTAENFSASIFVLRGESIFPICRVRRGPGGPRDSRPGGRRYLFFQRAAQ
jgi:hypothetical protein